jgi:large subunit ribosomal protein L22
MDAKAKLKFLRISPRKTRLVIDMIRGQKNRPMYVGEALALLRFCSKGAAQPVYKLLNSAITNAESLFSADVDELYIKTAYVDEGPTLKRFKPAAMGRASRIRKRTSHVTIIVSNE